MIPGAPPIVHVVVPAGIDDPEHPSGGNVYDRRVCQELAARGWVVHEHSGADLALVLGSIPDRSVVLVDGLIAADAVVPETSRLRIVVLLHMPVGDARERTVLSAVAAVVTTSRWARSRVVEEHGVPEWKVSVAEPGADLAPQTRGSRAGGELLCVGAVVPAKGHDLLLDALSQIAHLNWRCTCVGALDLDPAYVDQLGARAAEAAVADRVVFTGALTGSRLDAALAASDLLVSASRRESYGMAVTEALARGIPVAVSAVGGLPEAVGHAVDLSRPGMLFPANDAVALAEQLERWLVDPEVRNRLRRSAAGRRVTLAPWAHTARQVAGVLTESRVVC